jgi:PAS domain S-box-containing protein
LTTDDHSFELSRDGILILDASWNVVSANRSAYQLLHCTQPDLTGVDFWDAVQPVIAETQRQVAATALKLTGEHRFVVHLRFEDQSVEYSLSGGSDGYLVNLCDVTEEQKLLSLKDDAERRNRVLFDSNPTVMWVFDVDTQKILAANRAASDFYMRSAKKLQTMKMGALFPDGEGAALLHAISLKPDHPTASPVMLLCKQLKNDGQMVLVELAANRVEWMDRPCMLVSIADVSGRHIADTHLRRLNVDLERRLDERSRELLAASRDLEAFERAMSNDLKDPLHVLNGFARALTERYSDVLDKQGLHYVNRIQASTRQLAKLVDDLRGLTRLARQPVNWRETDFAPLCLLLIDELRQRFPEREVLLEMPEQLRLAGDKGMLVTALSHLIDNAWKFTAKKDQAWIRIGLAAGKTPGETVLSVSDNGAGFDPAYQDKLFTAFQRLHSSADFPGNGLGLAIVKAVADRLEGRVWAESLDGVGSTFFISVPPPPPEPPDSGGELGPH